jgi:capsular polysaccharide biosynthesis protein
MNSRRPRSVADYSRAARRRKLILLFPALTLAIATAIALWELPTLYESTARMRITSVKTDGTSDLSVRLNEVRQQLTTRETLTALISKNKLSTESSEAVISQIRGRIAVEPDASIEAQSGAFTVSYRATDPETARKATNELADRLVAQSFKEPSPAVAEAQVLRKRAQDISIQLRELEEKDPWLLGVRSDLSLIKPSLPAQRSRPSPEAIRAQQMTIESLKDQQYKIQQQLEDVDRRITPQRQIVEQQKKGSALRDNPTYAVLIAKRTELQGQRDTLINRQELTDKHPRVLAINDQIAAINRQVEELRQQDAALVSQSPEARELAALESERNRLKIDLEVTGREVARRAANPPIQAAAAPESSPVRRNATASKLVEQYLVLKRSYQDATSELQNAESKRQLADGASNAQLSVLGPATLPARPLSPNRPLLISIAAAVGLALGALFAFFAESRRFKSLQDARDVEYYTRLPLLAAIPRTATVSERRRARWRATARLAFATATSAIATFALTKIFIAADIFALIIKK